MFGNSYFAELHLLVQLPHFGRSALIDHCRARREDVGIGIARCSLCLSPSLITVTCVRACVRACVCVVRLAGREGGCWRCQGQVRVEAHANGGSRQRGFVAVPCFVLARSLLQVHGVQQRAALIPDAAHLIHSHFHAQTHGPHE
jgi:hypothetical protein